MNLKEFAQLLDHTLLKPEATPQEVERIAQEAVEFGFGAVFVNSSFVNLLFSLVGKRDNLRIGTVAGFPLGAVHTSAKCREAEVALEEGAVEIDMVINVGWLKSRKLKEFEEDLKKVKEVVKEKEGANIKAILEVGLLTEEEIKLASRIADELGFDYIKTATGFGPRGARLKDLEIIKSAIKRAKIKASGGIKTYQQALSFIQAGASRIGTSSALSIFREAQKELLNY
jgi:deoxyribose-phosphate aldolase